MATDSENLQTTLSNLIRVRAEASANPKPTYNINGQQVDWVGYYQFLSSEITRVQSQIADNEGPFEVVTQGFV